MKFVLPKIYPITDRSLSGLSHAEQTAQLIAGGAQLIQLREKSSDMREFYEDAGRAVELARNAGVTILINDRVDIALITGANGVHLGQDDLPPVEARRILGPDAIIGFSTHSVAQALSARDLPVDYVAIGPVFETVTKAEPDPVVGLTGLHAVRKAVGDIQLAAIGGINADNLGNVLENGADSIAVIRELYRNREISKHLYELQKIAELHNNVCNS